MEDVYLLLGSNTGDREVNIRRALDYLAEVPGMAAEAVSPVENTVAVDFEGPDFLNCVALFRCSLKPERLLEACKDIEWRMGRREVPEFTPDGRRIYHDRIIDIDILRFGDRVINTPALVIPHPQLVSRAFVAPLLSKCKK